MESWFQNAELTKFYIPNINEINEVKIYVQKFFQHFSFSFIIKNFGLQEYLSEQQTEKTPIRLLLKKHQL